MGTSPFRQFVLKVHSRCDLACDHCYVYEHADTSWRGRPIVISGATAAKAAERIAEHAREHALARVSVILHGGEPLLAGAIRLGEIARRLSRAITPVCDLDLRIHTNGVQLDEELCEVFLAAEIKVGISLDGDQSGNDRHRRYGDGRSSYDQVIRAVDLLRTERYRPLFAGLLCTIDVANDPVATYEALAALDPPAIDFLLPHATWDTPPPAAGPGTPYADWLITVFERWRSDRSRVPIRTFESIARTLRGARSLTESLGLEASDVAVIETDGAIEQADSIKVAYDGAPATGFNVFANALSEAAEHPAVKARQLGIDGLSHTCRRCPVVASCGGGLYAHRYRTANGFDNPSVYCADLKKLIGHVRARLIPSAPRAAITQSPGGRPVPDGQLYEADFDALAAGLGDGAAVAGLARAQRRYRMQLLRLLRVRAGKADEMFLAGWALLARLGEEHSAAFDQVIAHPYVRAWAEHSLRAGADTATLPADAAQLAAIAAAGAIRAGVRAEVTVPVLDGYVRLPTLGRLQAGGAPTAELTVGGAAFQVRTTAGRWDVDLDRAERAADWQPVRELRSGRLTVRLDDTDAYRDCHGWPAAPRLSDVDVACWQERFAEAWQLIESDYPTHADALATGLSTIMPLSGGPAGTNISASAREAFGAVGIALPADGETLAELLIHEFQHVKLGGLLDLYDLCDPHAAGRLFYAPWRDDPRPAEATLQGVYAHVGVTDYWRARRHRARGPAVAEAAERFARWRALTAEAIEMLASSGALSERGDRVVAGMRATVQPWLSEPVDAATEEAARSWADVNRSQWELRRRS